MDPAYDSEISVSILDAMAKAASVTPYEPKTYDGEGRPVEQEDVFGGD